jgi:DNA invertase Pin-like site-specific DNA recombinase
VKKPVRVVGYVRVSSDQQAESGLSLAAQEAKLRAYAVATDLELVEVVIDAGESARRLQRPGMARVLGMLDAGDAEGVLVAKLDRLTRSVRDLCDLVERYFTKRAVLLSVGDSIDTRSASGRLVLNVLASVGQWEREAIGERTREALAEVRRSRPGVHLGGVPLERKRAADGTLVDDVDGAVTLARIRELRASGLSLRAIAATLTNEGRPTKRGGAWGAEQISKALARAA